MKKLTLTLMLVLAAMVANCQFSLVFVPTPSGTNSSLLLDTNYTTINNDFIFEYNLWSTNTYTLATLSTEISSNALAILALQSSGLTNVAVTNTATLSAGSSATVTNYGVLNGIAYLSFGIPQGPVGPPATNAIYPTPETTLTNINPLYCVGSNYIGYFPQLFDWSLQLPNTSVGPSPGTNLNEALYGSFDSTNWFQITNSPSAIFTNIYVSVVGDNNTNYADALTLYAVSNYGYYGTTNQLFGQHLWVPPPTLPQDAVNLSSMQLAIANATGSTWQTLTDTNGVIHYRYSPYGQINEDLTAAFATGVKITAFRPSGTNWLLSVTNLPTGYQLQSSTNLLNTYGWATMAGYSLSTNSGTITATIPQYLIPANYAFFRVVSFQTASATFYPPVTLAAGTVYPSNTWSLAVVTNAMPNWSFANVNSNGVALVSVWMSNGVPYVKQLSP